MTRPKQQTNNQLSVDIAVMAEKVVNIEKKVTSIEAKLDKDYVTQEEFNAKFEPISKIVWGMVILIVTAFIGAVANLIFK